MFILLLSFNERLATKFLFLNDKVSMAISALIDLNLGELKYHPFKISLDKCSGSCNILSLKICAPKETNDINVKAFNILTNKNKDIPATTHISCGCKFKSATCNSNQKWNNKTC